MMTAWTSSARPLAAVLLWGSLLGEFTDFALGEEDPAGKGGESSVSELEHRIEVIDGELRQLARMSLRTGVGSIGYRSDSFTEDTQQEWIQIDLEQEEAIDQIVLVPCLSRNAEAGVVADGFPVAFRIVAGKGSGPESREVVVASFGADAHLLPRVAPLVVPCAGLTASWIRVEASVLSPRVWDGRYELQLAEILLFRGQENIAQQKPVQTSSSGRQEGGARRKEYLVDGFMPYLMDASQGAKSIAFVSWLRDEAPGPHQLTFDLGTVVPLNRIHLHSMEVNDNIPQSEPSNFGIPRRMLLEGANDPDFSDAVTLIDYQITGSHDAGPIIMRAFPETACRYVRLIALEPNIQEAGFGKAEVRLGFAEIELFAEGKNVAAGRPVGSNIPQSDRTRPFSALTDGRNLYGEILPLRDWLDQLARRHDLERERPFIEEELRNRYVGHMQTLSRLRWIISALIAVVLVGILISKVIRQRAILETRERIGADLHDELGASLHAIGLLGDMAIAAADKPERLNKLLQRLQGATTRAIDSVRYCTNLLEAKDLDENLVEDIQRASSRILSDLEHDLSFEGEAFMQDIERRQRLDFLLFYKECLVNILRHSGATRVSTEVLATNQEISLTVSDNGKGLGSPLGGGAPASLRRRARLLGGRVSAIPSDDGHGTRICLRVRNAGSWLPFRKIRS